MNFKVPLSNTLYLLVLIFIACNSQKKKDAADFFLKANKALQQNNYAEAIRFYNEAIDKNEAFADAYLNKGICLFKLNQPQDAIEVLTKAIEVDPTLVQANLVRSEIYLRLGNLQSSEADLNAISKVYKDSSSYFLIHGDLLQAKNDNAGALADYERALNLNAGNVEALVNRGALYYAMHAIPEAKKDFLAASRLNPSQSEALNNLGLISIAEKNNKQAIAYFDLVLKTNPADALALNNKGYALLLDQQTEEAGKLIGRSLDILPENPYALRNLGIYFVQKKDTDEALKAFNRAIDIAQPVDMLYGLTGRAYLSQKNSAKACEIWSKGKMLNDSISALEWAKNCL